MEVRESRAADMRALLDVHAQAFGAQEGPEIVELVSGLLEDPTAIPRLSLVALEDGKVLGHILFTRVTVDGSAEPVNAQILCPLGVLPAVQGQGVGGQLIAAGLERLRQSGVELVFVLGHPDYYPRSGFTPAGVHDLSAPYPILPQHDPAWMVHELRPGLLGRVTATVRCCEVLSDPAYWGPPEED